MVLEINIEGIRPIGYVLPRQIFCQAETMVEHKTLFHRMKVLRKITGEVMLKIIIIQIMRKMTGEGMLKIIIIKIIAIHLLLNL